MKFHSFIFFTLLNINILVGQYFELPRLGVLDFEPRAVPISLTQRFTEAFRNELENTNLAQVIDRGSLLSVVEERGYIRSNCITDYCEALVGRLLDANFILNGSIAYADSIYTIDINMVSVKTGAVDKTITLRVFGDYQNLMDAAESAAWNIFGLKSPQQIAVVEERERIARISSTKEQIIPVDLKSRFTWPTTLRSTLFPGWGQVYSDHRKLGLYLMGSEVVLGGLAFAFYKSYEFKVKDVNLYNRMYANTSDANKVSEFRKVLVKAEKDQIRFLDNFKYTLFTMGTIWALNVVHAVIIDLDRNVDNMPEVEIVFNESTNQPQLSVSIALD
jgi:hypothetical protein|tara:strand:+ start:380 stop:1375 length:996 start_codon:yes stop_codon:yes gene_type:complete